MWAAGRRGRCCRPAAGGRRLAGGGPDRTGPAGGPDRRAPRGPLAGRRILVTRPEPEAAPLATEIRRRGGVPVTVPLIATAPPAGAAALARLDRALLELERYDWIVFTSRSAAAVVLARLAGLNRAWPAGRVRVAAVGPGTAEPLAAAGIAVDLMPAEARWQGVARELPAAAAPGQRVLLPRSARAPEHLPRALRAAGLIVDDLDAYDTIRAPDAVPRLRAVLDGGPVDVVILASASAAEELAAILAEIGTGLGALGRGGRRPLVACIGPNTAADARRAGLPVDVAPERPGIAPMLQVLEQACRDRPVVQCRSEPNPRFPDGG